MLTVAFASLPPSAGILRDVSFGKMTEQDWKLLQQVHLDGAYAVTKAAWPYMREQKYGRVLMVTSAAGLYGNFGQVGRGIQPSVLSSVHHLLLLEAKPDCVCVCFFVVFSFVCRLTIPP